ncbi:MAG: hypothetical protein IT348_10295 [Candidatus Eisenbacteria bacterium]|nr:hypothetical protein [Candidatus Eisenbacteria bacterium]
MATKKATKKPTKTGFILSLPRDLPAAEAVEKAKAAGIKGLSETYVYKIRSKAKAGGGKKTSAKGKASPKKKGSKGSASDFIRQHPGKSANDVVELGKKKGVKFTISSVYQTRAYDKKRKGGSKKTKTKPGPKPKTPVFQVFPGGGGGSESDLKKAALAVGFPRALKVVEDLSRKFESVQRQYQALLS